MSDISELKRASRKERKKAASFHNGRMPKAHTLKTWPEPFEAMWKGYKTHEYRKNDRDYHDGDRLILREWDRDGERFTGRVIEVLVTYIGRGFGIPKDHVCMSIRELGRQA